MIQTVITRIANNSFLVKGWALTIAAAFFAVMTSRLSWKLSLTAFIPIMMFWALDTYFLRVERGFRHLYDDVRKLDGSIEIFSLNIAPYRATMPFVAVGISPTLSLFYGSLFVLNCVFFVGAIIQAACG